MKTYRVRVETYGWQEFRVKADSPEAATAKVRDDWWQGGQVAEELAPDWPTAKVSAEPGEGEG